MEPVSQPFKILLSSELHSCVLGIRLVPLQAGSPTCQDAWSHSRDLGKVGKGEIPVSRMVDGGIMGMIYGDKANAGREQVNNAAASIRSDGTHSTNRLSPSTRTFKP